MATSLSFTQVSAGRLHACGLTANGDAYCWGTGGALTPTLVTAPVVSGVPVRWKAITAGLEFTCAIASDDTAYCWGYDGYGQLGNGTTSFTTTTVPAQVLPPIGGSTLEKRWTTRTGR